MTTPTVRSRRPAPPQRPNPQAQGAVNAVPFTRAAREKSQIAFDTGTVNLSAASAPIGPIELPPAGYLKYLELEFTLTGNNTSASVAFAADAPWNAIGLISLTNSAGDSIIVPMTGYQLYLINKYGLVGNEPPFCDPERSPQYSVTTGTGATGGSAHWILRLPLETDPRDAFTAVPNLAANKSYAVQFLTNPTGSIYTTPPNGAGTIATLRITGLAHFWSQPNPTNAVGTPQEVAPRGSGSVSLWRIQTAALTAGDKLLQLTNVGNVIKSIIFVLRNASAARTASDWPGVSQIVLNNDVLFYLPLANWQHNMGEIYGYNTGAVEAAGGLDNGVYALPFFNDQRGKAMVDGPRDQYLPTLDSTLLQFRGTSFGAGAVTLEVITNEIKPVSALALYSPNLT